MSVYFRSIRGRKFGASIAFAVAIFTSSPTAFSQHGRGHGAPPAEHSEEAADEPLVGPKQIIFVEPLVEVDPELAAENVLRYLQAGVIQWKGGDRAFAESYFAAALGIPIDLPEKEQVLSRMAKLYFEDGMLSKAAAVYDRLGKEFPESRRLPEIYMEAGNIYRQMGAHELAISKFYMVLNSSLNVSFDQLEKYKQLSLEAKMQIAETHKDREEYQESYRLYQSLFLLDLKPVERLRVHYRMCYLLYELANYQQAVSKLKLFLDEYPESPHNPELRYLLAKSYERLNRKPEALQEVVNILKSQTNPTTRENNDAGYWKQRTGNELANEFYGKGDYRSALTIYQSLARYSAAPSWRWPAIHQIGLCFEHLGLPEKAKLAYEEIISPEGEKIAAESLGENLRSLQQMAKWRLEHLNWEDDLVARLQILKTR